MRPGAAPAALLLLAAGLAGCTGPSATGPPDVVATFYPLAYLAGEVAGPDLRIATLVPPGTEPHDWEPSPRDLQGVERARLFIHNGAGLEPWAEALAARLAAAGTAGPRIVEATAGLDLEHLEEGAGDGDPHAGEGAGEELDPHAWLSPFLAQGMAATIAEGIAAADPANASAHKVRAEALRAKLADLDRRFAEGLKGCAKRDIITTHAAFGYLASRYNFTQWSIAGLSPEAEPSPARLKEVADLARRLNVTHVFYETLVSPRVAEAVAREVGAKTLVLNPVEGLTDQDRAAGRTYLDLMGDNLRNLRTALGCP